MEKDVKKKSGKSMTFKQALKDPSMAPFHAAILSMEGKSNKQIFKEKFPKKYEMSVIDVALDRVAEQIDKDPNITLKKALVSVIKNLPKDISDDLLAKVVNQVFAEWAELVASAQKEKQILTPNHAPKQALELA